MKILGFTFMESYRTKIRQPSKYGTINHSNVVPNVGPFGKSHLGKRSDKGKEIYSCISSPWRATCVGYKSSHLIYE